MLVQALEDIWAITPDPRRDRLTVGFVTHLVSLATGVPAAEISAPRRATHAAVRARQLAIYLTHITFHWPLSRVAFAFGRDRTTCGHACRKIEDMREDATFDRRLSDLEACLRQAPAHAEEIPA
ncbi:helix-turn-helix domain-containing protein [Caulobacter sp. FWC2]|uniref:helix-turn-helix domain-containing protein n=1 Tax=Caulobacter sp. FWC2 TaxID=69664 RepID=UPI000C14B2D8|nr:helix-turn-helix domain-containing protein [Caulobacter sp. FWC2]PIB93370.1 chromosomal replication initiator DnaA [Caulobacter sp. FWC2]